MIADYTLNQIVASIYSFPELWGCTVLYIGNNQSRVLKQAILVTNNSKIVVLIEELTPDVDKAPTTAIKYNQAFQGDELKGGIINCTFAVISAIEVFGGAAAEPVTGGFSTVVVYAGYVGMATSGAQCINSIARTVVAYSSPLGRDLEGLDSNGFYNLFTKAIDIANIASGFGSIAGAGRDINTFLALRGSLASEEKLAAMTNAQRIKAYDHAVKKVSQNRQVSEEFYKLLNDAGRVGRRMAAGNPVIIRREVQGFSKLVANATLDKLSLSVKSVLVNSASIGMNGLPAQYVGTASGEMNKVGNLVFHVIAD